MVPQDVVLFAEFSLLVPIFSSFRYFGALVGVVILDSFHGFL